MRTAGSLVLASLVLGGCNGLSFDVAPARTDVAPPSTSSDVDAPAGIAPTADRGPVVGTLRMRDRDVLLTTEALEAVGNESLREMTARAVWADIDDAHVGRREALSAPSADPLAPPARF